MSNVLKLSDLFSVVLYLDRSWGVPSQQLYVQAAVPVLVLWIGHRGFLLNGAGEIIDKAQKCIRRSWVLGEVPHGTSWNLHAVLALSSPLREGFCNTPLLETARELSNRSLFWR